MAQRNDKEDAAFVRDVWVEMWSRNTIDTFRPRLLTTPGLLEELAQVSRLTRRSERWRSHCADVLEELKVVAKSDPVITQRFPSVASSLSRLSAATNPMQLTAEANVLSAELKHRYDDELKRHIRECAAKLPKEKEGMLSALRLLASRRNRDGLGGMPIGKSADAVLESIFRELDAPPAACAVFLPVWGTSRSEVESLLSHTDFMLMRRRDKPRGKPGEVFMERFPEHGDQKFIAVATIEAESAAVAAIRPLARLRQAINVANFYHNSHAFGFESEALVVENHKATRVGLTQEGSLLQPRHDAASLSQELLSKFSGTRHLEEAIHRSLEHHTLAFATTKLKVRFLSLWTALETLVDATQAQNIFDAVTAAYVPLVAGRRIRKLVTYWAIRLHVAGVGEKLNKTSHFSRSGASRVRNDELLMALCHKTEGSPLAAVLETLNDQILLRHQLAMAQKDFSVPTMLRRTLTDSEQRLGWQFRRIYRARNLLVHEADEIPSLRNLVENLAHYYSISVSRVLHDLVIGRANNLDEAFALRRLHHGYVSQSLKEEPQRLTVGDLLGTRGPYKDIRPWKSFTGR